MPPEMPTTPERKAGRGSLHGTFRFSRSSGWAATAAILLKCAHEHVSANTTRTDKRWLLFNLRIARANYLFTLKDFHLSRY